jgi:twitching motility two-component system response regulator PilG
LFDRARGRMVGSDQYLTKPFTKETLLEAVQTYAVTNILNKRKKAQEEA